jgi:hypothetical protein
MIGRAMELDPIRMKQLAYDVWMLRAKLRFLGYHMTTETDRQKGQYTIDDLVSEGNWDALRSNTDEMIEGTIESISNALFTVKEVKEYYSKVIVNMDWFESILNKS